MIKQFYKNNVYNIMIESLKPSKYTTTLQIISDVHLEFRKSQPTIPPYGENLAILGDIGKPGTDIYNKFITTQSEHFNKVFLIMGNHDYYHSKDTVDKILLKTKDICNSFNNVYLLERDSFQITEKTSLLGCSLWSHCDPEIVPFLNDFKKIHIKDINNYYDDPLLEWKSKKLLDVNTYNSWHDRDVKWLDYNIQKRNYIDESVVILTHHSPLKIMGGKYINNNLHSAFTTDLKHLFKYPVIAFCNGHVHSNCDVKYNNIRCVSNALGYENEDTGYSSNVVIDIP
jgi:hypothetical protein